MNGLKTLPKNKIAYLSNLTSTRIKKEILDPANTFAKSHSDINNVELGTIERYRKSLLFSNSKSWGMSFDVAMCSYDGAEICELEGIYTLTKLENKTSKDDIGLYRDDDLYF